MWVDVYSNMYNEAKLLPFWLRHYEQIANRIFVWDDESTDATNELLRANPKVTLLPMEKHGNDDIYYVTELFPQYEVYSRGVADWVIVADADEFIYHPNLLEVLQAQLDKGVTAIKCEGYMMVAESFPEDRGQQIYEEVKLGLPDKLSGKWTIHSPNALVRWNRGRHGPPYGHRNLVMNRYTHIKLLHYRYFGDEYYNQRSRRTTERNWMAQSLGYVYSLNRRTTQPDGERCAPIPWFNKHKVEVRNVIDE